MKLCALGLEANRTARPLARSLPPIMERSQLPMAMLAIIKAMLSAFFHPQVSTASATWHRGIRSSLTLTYKHIEILKAEDYFIIVSSAPIQARSQCFASWRRMADHECSKELKEKQDWRHYSCPSTTHPVSLPPKISKNIKDSNCTYNPTPYIISGSTTHIKQINICIDIIYVHPLRWSDRVLWSRRPWREMYHLFCRDFQSIFLPNLSSVGDQCLCKRQSYVIFSLHFYCGVREGGYQWILFGLWSVIFFKINFMNQAKDYT